jgi:hypothetical protein
MPSWPRAANSPRETRNERINDGVVVRVIQPPNSLIAGLTLSWILGSAVPGVGCAQGASVDLPANSYPTGERYGRAWECTRGYRVVANACVIVEVPQNAYLNAPGDAWKCERGYRKVDESCLQIEAPANSYLSMVGDDWVCDRGYRKLEQSCVAITVPANGYATNAAHGPGWSCDRGYRAVSNACVTVDVPANGYLVDFSYGPGWECNRSYRKASAGCIAVEVPLHGHLDYSGNDWECDRQYRKQRDRCELPLTQEGGLDSSASSRSGIATLATPTP